MTATEYTPCDPSPTSKGPADLAEVVTILQPAQGASGCAQHPLDPNCNIAASGNVNAVLFKEIVAAQARVNGGTWNPYATIVGRDWAFDAVGPAVLGMNTFEVQVTVIEKGTGKTVTLPIFARCFIGVGGSSACGFQTAWRTSGPAGVAILETLPRFYCVHLDVQSLDPTRCGEKPLVGGVPHLDHIYLAYDAARATPELPVWRSINLPESAGAWTLRVWQSNCRLIGELMVVFLNQRLVQPPITLRCLDWDLHGLNVLGTAFVPSQTADRAALAATIEAV